MASAHQLSAIEWEQRCHAVGALWLSAFFYSNDHERLVPGGLGKDQQWLVYTNLFGSEDDKRLVPTGCQYSF